MKQNCPYCYDDYNLDADSKDAAWPDVLKPEEVQSYLCIGKSAFYQLVQSGELPAFRVKKLWRVKLKELEKFCENHQTI